MDSPCALRGIEYSPLLGGVKTKAQSGQLACPKSQSGGESGSLQGSQACPLPERLAHHTDWDSSHGAPSGFGLCFLTEDTHMSHRTPLPCLTPACRPGCSPHFSCEEPKVWGGWGLTRSHTASSFVALRQPSERRASGSTLGRGSWGLGALPGPTYGLTAIPPPRLSLFSLQQKTPCCAQPAHHYPPSRAIPARLGRGGRVLRGSSHTRCAGASVVWAPPLPLTLSSTCQDQAPCGQPPDSSLTLAPIPSWTQH